MNSEPKLPARVAFGPFQLDVRSGELRKHGMRLRLAGQSLQILEVLLERPNQVVAREELQQRLWNGTTYVDFNQGLNAAVNKLRQTLGDSADQPRYVETVPGKGYRFVAPLSQDSDPPVDQPQSASLAPEIAEDPSPKPEETASDAHLIRPEKSFAQRFFTARVALFLVIGIAIAGCLWFSAPFLGIERAPSGSIAQLIRYQISIPEGIELPPDQLFSISPDGKNLAYFARKKGVGPFVLWIQSLDSITPRSLPMHQTASLGIWSPDSRFIFFPTEGKLKKADLTGNPAQEVGLIQGVIGGAIGGDGTLIFGTETRAIVRLDTATGDLVPVTVRDAASERAHIFPVFLSDGKHFLYSRFNINAAKNGVYVGSLDVKPEQQSHDQVIATPFAVKFVKSDDGKGVILFQRDATVWAQRFDPSLLRLTGEPRIVAEQVGHIRALGYFAASSGVLVHRSVVPQVAQLTWLDRHGKTLGKLGAAADHFDNPPRISPDGSKIALTQFGTENTDIWIHDLSRDVTQRLTFQPSIDQSPIWSPDSKNLVFSSSSGGRFDLYQTSASGNGGPELLVSSNDNKFATSWSADGRFILFETEKRNGIWVLPLEGPGKRIAVSLLHTPANERSGVFSPDSQWIAYVSNESGQPEVYVQSFSFPSSNPQGRSKMLISRGGGTSPRWRADGKEIFYRATDGKLMSVPLLAGSALRPGVSQSMFASDRLWEATGDGNRFLVSVPVEQGLPPFTVVLNWQSALKN